MTRAASPPRAEPPTPQRGIVHRVLPYWWAVAIVALVLASAIFARDPIRDAATLGPSTDATLRLPISYVVLAPVSNVLDTVSLLSLRQHIAVVVTLLLAWAIWWWRRGHILPASVPPERRVVRRIVRVGLPLLGLISLYAAASLLPRPMAALDVAQPVVVVDFHSHTKYSHDGRADWEAEDVRAWHRNAGFHVAYITDHRTFDGAREGWANNTANAGETTTLLPSIEVVWNGEHVNVLDADRFYRGVITPSLRDIDADALRFASAIPGSEPVVIETFPGDLRKTTFAAGSATAGVRAIEIDDGAPLGLGQTRRERTRIVAIADSLKLALVSGSNNHGWGRTASGWTLLLMPRWRGLGPEELSTAISDVIRREGRDATKVVVRYMPNTDDGLIVAFTAPVVAWGMFRTLSLDERVVWIVWTMLVVALVWLRRRRDSGADARA